VRGRTAVEVGGEGAAVAVKSAEEGGAGPVGRHGFDLQ
jgi:hypothetical protein